MHISSEQLPDGCELLRLHPLCTPDYIACTLVKPINRADCELVGFTGEVTREILKLAFVECVKLGYDYCYIERRRKGKITRKRFKL